MIEWTGTLAVLETPTPDGRTLLKPERLLSRPLPLPLFTLDSDQPAGAITSLSIHGDELQAEGTIRDGILRPGHPLPAALDADQTAFHTPPGGGLVFTSWRVVGATLITDASAPWPQARIRVKGEHHR